MKKTNKFICVIIISIVLIFLCNSMSYALGFDPAKITSSSKRVSTTELSTIGGKIASITRTIGVILSVVILMVLGIKYMMGSVEEKADYKKSMIPYFIGALILFGASTFATIIYEFAIKLNK